MPRRTSDHLRPGEIPRQAGGATHDRAQEAPLLSDKPADRGMMHTIGLGGGPAAQVSAALARRLSQHWAKKTPVWGKRAGVVVQAIRLAEAARVAPSSPSTSRRKLSRAWARAKRADVTLSWSLLPLVPWGAVSTQGH